MGIKLSVVSYLMFLFHKSMAWAVYLRKTIIFAILFHIVCISHYNLYKESIDAKSKQNCKLSTGYA